MQGQLSELVATRRQVPPLGLVTQSGGGQTLESLGGEALDRLEMCDPGRGSAGRQQFISPILAPCLGIQVAYFTQVPTNTLVLRQRCDEVVVCSTTRRNSNLLSPLHLLFVGASCHFVAGLRLNLPARRKKGVVVTTGPPNPSTPANPQTCAQAGDDMYWLGNISTCSQSLSTIRSQPGSADCVVLFHNSRRHFNTMPRLSRLRAPALSPPRPDWACFGLLVVSTTAAPRSGLRCATWPLLSPIHLPAIPRAMSGRCRCDPLSDAAKVASSHSRALYHTCLPSTRTSLTNLCL
ncbi:unnamed protein product [Protopolystoma xenopodis]|uniref:Uncharacterized protein n=1 Tax=Protopolystoma xenopodis TaxID=117903 RepID=A0A448XPA4_9PLAT|nr:unnamed protein product [Protopolystoma xenopodis]